MGPADSAPRGLYTAPGRAPGLRDLCTAMRGDGWRVPLRFAVLGDAWLRAAWAESRDPKAMLPLGTGEPDAWVVSMSYWGARNQVTLEVAYRPGFVQPVEICFCARLTVEAAPWQVIGDARRAYDAGIIRQALDAPTIAQLARMAGGHRGR